MAAQASEIDAVSGATITSKAVMAAAKKCIQQAKGEIPVEVVNTGKASDEDPSDWLGQPPEIAESQIRRTVDADIVVVGCGTGGLCGVRGGRSRREGDRHRPLRDRHGRARRPGRVELPLPEGGGARRSTSSTSSRWRRSTPRVTSTRIS